MNLVAWECFYLFCLHITAVLRERLSEFDTRDITKSRKSNYIYIICSSVLKFPAVIGQDEEKPRDLKPFKLSSF